MTTQLNMNKDIKGTNTFAIGFSDTAFQFLLTTGVPTPLTIPSATQLGYGAVNAPSSFVAIITTSKGGNIWVSPNQTATAPVGAPIATTSILNPGARVVKSGDVISFLTPDTGVYVSVELFLSNPN